jgi:hypothetical protein
MSGTTETDAATPADTTPATHRPPKKTSARTPSENLRPLTSRLPPRGRDPKRFALIGPYDPDPRHWHELPWRNIHDPDSPTYRLRTDSTYSRGGNPLSRGSVGVLTYRDVLAAYSVHPEPKSLGPNGRACRRSTVGVLHRRPVQALSITHIGKETNLLDEVQAGLISDEEQVLTEYVDQQLEVFATIVLPVLCEMPIAVAARASHLNPRTIKRIRAQAIEPSSESRRRLLRAAATFARGQREGLEPQRGRDRDDLTACAKYLAERPARACPVCGMLVAQTRATYCSRRCRDRAYRSRRPRLRNDCSQIDAKGLRPR